MRLSTTFAASLSALLLSACADAARVASPELEPVSKTARICDPDAKYCDEDDYPAPPPPGLSLPISPAWCGSATTFTPDDKDGDGLRDECAFQLAVAFAPMMVHRNEAPYPHPAGIPGEYLVAVGPAPGSPGIRIGYLPAYYRDEGFTVVGGSSHSGDAEFVIVEVVYDGYDGVSWRWKTSAIFLSNHCGAVDPILGFFSADPNCKWYNPDSFGYVGNRHGAPYVWVADGKHANYVSYAHCQGAASGLERCDFGPRMHTRFPVSRDFWLLRHSSANWAERSPNRIWLTLTDFNKIEDFWLGRTEWTFNGWQSSTWGGGGGNYGDMLRFFGIYKVGGTQMPGEFPCDREAKYCP